MYLRPSTTLRTITPKRSGKNPETIPQEVIYHGILPRTFSRYQAFKKPLWKQSEDASQKSSWNQISIQIYQGHQTTSAQFTNSELEMYCAWPGHYHILTLTRIKFHPPKVIPLTNLAGNNGNKAVQLSALATENSIGNKYVIPRQSHGQVTIRFPARPRTLLYRVFCRQQEQESAGQG